MTLPARRFTPPPTPRALPTSPARSEAGAPGRGHGRAHTSRLITV